MDRSNPPRTLIQHAHLSGGLRECLRSASTGSLTRKELERLLAVSHALATAFLSAKSTTSTLRSLSGLSTPDLAYDCIADLFARSADGEYAQLRSYFAGIALEGASDAELLAHLRRLVFAKVNQGVFRLYGEADPQLARILRNLKLAIASLGAFSECERFGEACIAPSLCDSLEHLPAFTREELEGELLRVTTGKEMIPQMLASLALLLRQQSERCRVLPLVEVAFLIRRAYERKELPEASAAPEQDTGLGLDVSAAVQRSCAVVRARFHEKYAGRGKVSEALYERYFHIIQAELCSRYTGEDGDASSLQERLRRELPEAERERSFLSHRHKVEYLLKHVHREAVKELQTMRP
jgi:hypothetical protein